MRVIMAGVLRKLYAKRECTIICGDCKTPHTGILSRAQESNRGPPARAVCTSRDRGNLLGEGWREGREGSGEDN